jgi:D-glycero-D-manno-heptose 1,7-bisphosphate phosphatase
MKLIILDRDGVINDDSPEYIKSVDEWCPIPGSVEAIARLNAAGYRVVIATNQSGIARGLYDLEAMHAIHRKLSALLVPLNGRIDGIFFCPHGPQDHCDCRKPKTGLFKQIAQRLRVDITKALAVGDSLRDIQAAIAAGAKPVLVRTGKGEETLRSGLLPADIPVFDDLAAFAAQLAGDNR